MIYCNQTSVTADSGTYDFGMDASNLTGIITFSKDSFEILKWPNEENTCRPWLRKLLAKYRKEFEAGVFKEKLAYECG